MGGMDKLLWALMVSLGSFKTDNLGDTERLECYLKDGGDGDSVGVLRSVRVSAHCGWLMGDSLPVVAFLVSHV